MIYIFLAEGFEEIEAFASVDLLRRCELDVKTVGINSNIIRSSRGIPVITDLDANEIILDDNLQMIVLPGGMPGTLNLEKSQKVHDAINFCVKNDIYVAAICAAPSILGHKGLLDNKIATCFPGYESELKGATLSEDIVCKDGKIITGKSAGVSIEFSLALVETLISKERAELLKDSLQCK